MIVRRAQIEDFLSISELDRTAWSENRVADYIPDGEHIWRFWVEYSSVFVAKHGTRTVGAAIAFRANQSGLFMCHKLFVDHEFRNLGAGSQLLRQLCEDIDRFGADCVTTVDPVNEAMLSVCSRYGFTDKELVRSYYRSNEDRYVLLRRAGRGSGDRTGRL